MDVPVNISASVTIFLLVAFGIFIYPWLLKRRLGVWVAAVLTAALALLYYVFDSSNGVETGTSIAVAIILALLPLGTALLVRHFQRKGEPKS